MLSPRLKKLGEAMLYVARKSEGDRHFGAIKLNKILFYSDFLAYGRLGKSITGQDYQKLPKGPAPVDLPKVFNSMEGRYCAYQFKDHYGYRQKRLIALRDANLSRFSGNEIAIIDEIIERLRRLTATQVSDLSHLFIGVDVVDEGEIIPYETIFISNRELTEKENKYALKLTRTDAA